MRDRTLGGADVRDGSLFKRDFKAGQLPAGARGAAGSNGSTGSAGPTGAEGPTGPRGPSDVWQVKSGFAWQPNSATLSVNLPAGNYLVQGRMAAYNDNSPTTGIENPSCTLFAVGAGELDRAYFEIAEGAETPVTVFSAVEFTTPKTVDLFCNGGASLEFGRGVLVATEVTTVH